MQINTRTVLVVEDDAVVRRQIVRILEQFGYKLLQAPDGQEAIRIIDSQEIHLVVTDLRMPFGGGISLLKYVKIFFPQIPVIVVTAYPEDLKDIQPDALICKPFGSDKLIYSVQHLIQ